MFSQDVERDRWFEMGLALVQINKSIRDASSLPFVRYRFANIIHNFIFQLK